MGYPLLLKTYMSLEVFATGDKAHGDDDLSSHLPIKIAGVSMISNPTKVANAKRTNIRTDAVGRIIDVPYQVRELVSTGYAALTRVAESTIIAGVAGSFLDLVQVTATNTSSNAIGITIRSVTAGNTEDTLVAPAGGTVVKTFAVPLPQNNSGNNWTAQTTLTGDISDSPVTVSMIAVQNL